MRAPPGGSARLAERTLRRFLADGMPDRAPALAYYGILSLFPTLLLAFAVVRLAGGPDTGAELAQHARDAGTSGAVADTLRDAADTARAASAQAAGGAGLAGALALVYGASRAFTATGRALDVIAGRASPTRSMARRAQDIAWTLVLLAMALALLFSVLVTGRVLEVVVDAVGLDRLIGSWRLARWPAAAALALLIVALVRYAAPTQRPAFRLLTPGIGVTVVALIVETVGYDLYVSHVATYNATYGAFAGAIILLLWVWLVAIAFLAGAELDAALADPGDEAPVVDAVGRAARERLRRRGAATSPRRTRPR